MAKKAILLTNLGSPDSTKVSDVRKYLNEFLMDERVIDIPYLLRLLLVKGIISPTRAFSSAKAYKSIWTKNGSPLIHTTKQLRELVEKASGIKTYICMRYRIPSAEDTLKQITKENDDLEELTMLPLYPHYAMSSYETAVVDVRDKHQKGAYPFKLKVVDAFYKDTNYIDALAASIKPYLDKKHDLILFSYHGIPERHVRKTDPSKKHCLMVEDCCAVKSDAHEFCYRHQVFETTKLVAEKLGIAKDKHMVSFQSRLGKDPWLTPFTADLFEKLPKQGVKDLIVVCPAFVSDCLETLEEIDEEGREDFLEAGGQSFEMIPCLNLNSNWVNSIVKLVESA